MRRPEVAALGVRCEEIRPASANEKSGRTKMRIPSDGDQRSEVMAIAIPK